jgi:hypothetical protein
MYRYTTQLLLMAGSVTFPIIQVRCAVIETPAKAVVDLLSSIHLAGGAGNEMKIWVSKSGDGVQDDGVQNDSNEVIIAHGQPGDGPADDEWHQYSADVAPMYSFAVINFGLLSGGQIWFDFMR